MASHNKIKYLNFDTLTSTKTNNDVFDTVFILNQKYTNIKKIYLKNAEIPIGFPNFRSSNNSNVLRFVLNGVSYNATITQQNYSSISSLLTALNASIVTALTSTGFSLVLSSNTSNTYKFYRVYSCVKFKYIKQYNYYKYRRLFIIFYYTINFIKYTQH